MLTLATLGAFSYAPALAHDASAAAELPACASVRATLVESVGSATANVGDVFHFTTVASTTGATDALPAGLTGLGVVSYAQHARRETGGQLAIEARYVVMPDGTKTSVSNVSIDAVSRGSNRDAPAILGVTGAFKRNGKILPILGFIGGVVGVYGFIHHGSEASLAPATPMLLVIGDGIEEGQCSIDSLMTGNANYRRRANLPLSGSAGSAPIESR
jgi:hypothetical protein